MEPSLDGDLDQAIDALIEKQDKLGEDIDKAFDALMRKQGTTLEDGEMRASFSQKPSPTMSIDSDDLIEECRKRMEGMRFEENGGHLDGNEEEQRRVVENGITRDLAYSSKAVQQTCSKGASDNVDSYEDRNYQENANNSDSSRGGNDDTTPKASVEGHDDDSDSGVDLFQNQDGDKFVPWTKDQETFFERYLTWVTPSTVV